MTTDRTQLTDGVDLSGSVSRDTVRSVSKIGLAAASLVFVLYLVSVLPGLDRIIPWTPITFVALVGAVATVALVVLLLYAAPKIASLARMSLQGPQRIVENLVSILYWLVVLSAVFVAHRGLAGAVLPFLGGLGWLYDVAFLLLALPITAFIAARLYTSLDPGADLLADKLVGEAETNGSESRGSGSRAPGASGSTGSDSEASESGTDSSRSRTEGHDE